MAVVGNDLLDGIFHAVEVGKRWITLDLAVREDTAQARVVTSVDDFGFADGSEHTLGGSGVGEGVGFAEIQVFAERQFFWLLIFVLLGEIRKRAHQCSSVSF
ncbi:hypothetical protein D3C75_957440 [compost metagenome]